MWRHSLSGCLHGISGSVITVYHVLKVRCQLSRTRGRVMILNVNLAESYRSRNYKVSPVTIKLRSKT